MKILYIFGINHKVKSGLFYATTNRISHINKIKSNDFNYDCISIVYIDTLLLKLLKRILKKTQNIYPEGNEIVIDSNLTIKYIKYKRNLVNLILGFFLKGYEEKIIIKKIEKFYRLDHYNLIHVHWLYPHGYIAKLLGEKYNISYFLTVHGSDIFYHPFRSKRIKKLSESILNNALKVLFVSKNLYDFAKQNLSFQNKSVHITPNGINQQFFEEVIDKNIKFNSNVSPTVGFIGNLEWSKGADLLPNIFNNINMINPLTKFIIIGKGSYYKSIKDKINKRNLDTFFTGHINQKELLCYLKAFDVLLVPSRYEGFGLVALESLACGVPVVASHVGALPELIDHYGETVELSKSFVSDFALKVTKTINKNYDKKELINYSKRFKWSNLIQHEYDLYLKER
jgi:glycosyltransferase involved in cell wall biosynthesis